MIKPRFEIGQYVYHKTPDSPKGIVTNIVYKYKEGYHMYEISFSPTEASLWYYDTELSETITF